MDSLNKIVPVGTRLQHFSFLRLDVADSGLLGCQATGLLIRLHLQQWSHRRIPNDGGMFLQNIGVVR